VIREIAQSHFRLFEHLAGFEERHPYLFSFIVALLFLAYLLFHSPSLEISEDDLKPAENIQFVDIDTLQSAQRVAKQDISTEEGEAMPSEAAPDRATGVSDDSNAVDISFYPNVAPPRLVTSLPKYYPQLAKDNRIEAVVYVELLIGTNGIVRNVSILGISLSQALPPERHSAVARDFARDAIRTLQGAQFTPPVVNGSRVPIKMEMPLKFRLE
jgi:outer membrane biosynthesis protein TonB